ncbi:nuclear transport factor 2 family protein [Bradyrhizobium tunisiense]|uniref:nuclear transport factor 2 family protein n=1 Tax=Bradyrhizobium tunisiense TaxID=3278709 RepID=UPI0035DE85A7
MPQYHQPSTLAALGRTWIEAWNSRDLERVLTLYDEAAVMTSDRIPALGFDASGTLRGKDALRAYWGKALGLVPELHFSLIELFGSPDSVVVFYANERGKKICEYLRVDAAGKIVQGSANHLAE